MRNYMSSVSRLRLPDVILTGIDDGTPAWWANRILFCGLTLFALSLPHSIAAAQISLGICFFAWIGRDLVTRRFNFTRTPIDLPLLCFASLTVISSIFSTEPGISLPKLKTLLVFGVIYIVATNLRASGVAFLVGALIVSSLAGVCFSLAEKVWGRGMIVTTIEADSPLAGSRLQPGDVIWMIGRRRVSSLEEAANIIRQHRAGKVLGVEALHAGDPVPITLEVTEDLKTRSNPLGISVNGRSRQFRISGFSRQFQTYAELMQILALLTYGGLLASIKLWKRHAARTRLLLLCLVFVSFALALALTASRAVIASFIVALLFVSISVGGRFAPVIAVVAVLTLGGVGAYVVTSTRQQVTLNFNDDSASRRLAYMRAGLRLIPQYPLLGVGIDAHKRHWEEWGFPGDYVTHTHSTPIQIALDRGLPALGCYLWLMGVMMAMAWRGFKQALQKGDVKTSGLMIGAFAVLIGFSASSLVNYNFGDSEALMMLLFIMGLVAVANIQN